MARKRPLPAWEGFAVDGEYLYPPTISEEVKLRPRKHVRDDAGHDGYITERHASGRRKHMKDL